MTQSEALSVGNAHSPRGGGQTNNPTTNIKGTYKISENSIEMYYFYSFSFC